MEGVESGISQLLFSFHRKIKRLPSSKTPLGVRDKRQPCVLFIWFLGQKKSPTNQQQKVAVCRTRKRSNSQELPAQYEIRLCRQDWQLCELGRGACFVLTPDNATYPPVSSMRTKTVWSWPITLQPLARHLHYRCFLQIPWGCDLVAGRRWPVYMVFSFGWCLLLYIYYWCRFLALGFC